MSHDPTEALIAAASDPAATSVAAAAEIARGNGPQQVSEMVTSVWNLYTWQALGPGLTLPDGSDYDTGRHWKWYEGVPLDIVVFEGRRVILLGPPSYPRSWQAQRLFDKLPAALDIERALTKAECGNWLEQMLLHGGPPLAVR